MCQLEIVLDFSLVNLCMKECEFIKGDHTLGLLAVNVSQRTAIHVMEISYD